MSNPYNTLLSRAQKFAYDVAMRPRKGNGYFPKGDFVRGFRMDYVAKEIETAKLLGYDTVLENSDRGIEMVFVKRPPDSPF